MKVSFSKLTPALPTEELLLLAIDKASLSGKNKSAELLSRLDQQSSGALRREIKRVGFKADNQKQQLVHFSIAGLPSAVLLLGVELRAGESSTKIFDRSSWLRKVGYSLGQIARSHKFSSIALIDGTLDLGQKNYLSALLEGIHLSTYRYLEYKSKEREASSIEKVSIYSKKKLAQSEISRAELFSNAISYTRDLVNKPSRDCTPQYLAAEAKKIAKLPNCSVKIYTPAELRRMKAFLMLSVFDSSNVEACLIRIHYRPKGKAKRKVALVGKGVTFDTGGLCIKSRSGMYDMKCDMAGAAAVLATMRALPALHSNSEVVAYIPTTENMINATSTKPGDIVYALNGKSVEVLNTDAEGRLILGDALVLAEREKVDAIIDLATLTGSCAQFLGSEYAGLFCENKKLTSQILEASEEASERLWSLPFAPEYRDQLKSNVADIRNIGGGSDAGAIISALFLQEFVEKTPWAHLDIAGPAHIDSEKGLSKKGGTGFGVRTLLTLLGNH